MKFSETAELAKNDHRQLLAVDRNNRAAIDKLTNEVTYTISHLIQDIQRSAKGGSGPRRKLWHIVTDDLTEMYRSAKSVRKSQDSTEYFFSVNKNYDSIIAKIRDLEN